MSDVLTSTSSETCGCCDGVSAETPARIDNAPGLSVIRYRAGDHAAFKASMLTRLSTARLPALRGLNTREDDDFTIALLDAWACVADVLTFYNERIAAEAYLRTATERRSVLELARLVGYELAPGVAAAVDLAFTVESAPGAPGYVTVAAGTRVQSVPAPGEKPQLFETTVPVEARAVWNAMRPRLTRRHPLTDASGTCRSSFYLQGIATGLRVGDGLLVAPEPEDTGADGPCFALVSTVAPDPLRDRTEVRLRVFAPAAGAATAGAVATSPTPGPTASRYLGRTIAAADLRADALVGGFTVASVFQNLTATAPPPPGVTTFRVRASLFGHNAPHLATLPYAMREDETVFEPGTGTTLVPKLKAGPFKGRTDTWADAAISTYLGYLATRTPPPETATSSNVYLDAVYPDAVASTPERPSVAVLRSGASWRAYAVEAAAERSLADFTLTGKLTRLTLGERTGLDTFTLRGTSVYAASELLALAPLPIDEPVAGREVELGGLIEGLYPGQALLFCGESAAEAGVRRCERAVIEAVAYRMEREPSTVVTLVGELAHAYVRTALTVSGNVAPATHGETTREVMGSGDGARRFPAFTLRQPPLTHVPAPAGTASTLEVYVGDVRWSEVPFFYERGPSERVFTARQDDDGRTTVRFGDGRTGARLPTGQENVRARYRKGTGRAGSVGADALTLLMTMPAGLKNVTNPLPAAGGDDAERLEDARANAPLTVLTLGRVVSLRDYESFARALAGIGKALATWTWTGERRGVFLTVAGPGGATLAADSPTLASLRGALLAAGDPFVAVEVRPHAPRLFRLDATLIRDPAYSAAAVLAGAEAALRAAFAFEPRAFGQAVTVSEVAAVLHGVAGLVAADIDALYRADEPAALHPALVAAAPRAGTTGAAAPAELLTLDPGPVALRVTP